MKNYLKLSLTAFVMGLMFLTACQDEEEVNFPRPNLTSDKNALFLTPGSTESFSVNISAAGLFQEIIAESSSGSVEVVEVSGAGTASGNAKIEFTAPIEESEGSITITASDRQGQVQTMEVSYSVEMAPPMEIAGGEVSGVWESGNTYIVRGDVIIPEGQSLKIEEGVTVIIDGDGGQGSPEFAVRGNIYSIGTADRPVIFTIPEDRRTASNILEGMWGGINCLSTTDEAVFIHTHIEFGGAVAGPNSVTVQIGQLDEGDERYAIYFDNENGKLILMNSRLAYTSDDAIRLEGGQILIAHNHFEFNGKDGGEGMNVNSGVTGDIAFNTFYSMATNAVKWDNKGGKTPQTDVNIYNNTILNSGWRQTKSGRGGSLNAQRDGRGVAYNNLIVNCRFGVRLRDDQLPDLENISVGHNFHYGNSAEMAAEFYPSSGVLVYGDMLTDNDISGEEGENDPLFVNYDVTAFDYTSAGSTAVSFANESNDFRLSAESPALNIGLIEFTPRFQSMSANGTVYTAPAPALHAGANSN
jgi:hypothetical protein